MQKTLNFVLEKETKGAVRYGDNKHSIYFKKEELSQPYPKAMEVIIKTMEEGRNGQR